MSTEETPPLPIWARPEPGSRSPRFTREQIAAKAMEIADRDGIGAVSMRKVAAELGAGTMTLYHYVQNKQELLDLMHDAMMGELRVPDAVLEAGDWREALRAIAHASLDTWRRHGWLQEPEDRRPVFGPNGMRHFEQSLAAAATTGLPKDRRMEVIAQVDDYVAGYVKGEHYLPPDPDGAGQEEVWAAIAGDYEAYLQETLATGDYPHIEEFLGGESFEAVVRRMLERSTPNERFDRGLERLLDGVQLEIDRLGED